MGTRKKRTPHLWKQPYTLGLQAPKWVPFVYSELQRREQVKADAPLTCKITRNLFHTQAVPVYIYPSMHQCRRQLSIYLPISAPQTSTPRSSDSHFPDKDPKPFPLAGFERVGEDPIPQLHNPLHPQILKIEVTHSPECWNATSPNKRCQSTLMVFVFLDHPQFSGNSHILNPPRPYKKLAPTSGQSSRVRSQQSGSSSAAARSRGLSFSGSAPLGLYLPSAQNNGLHMEAICWVLGRYIPKSAVFEPLLWVLWRSR